MHRYEEVQYLPAVGRLSLPGVVSRVLHSPAYARSVLQGKHAGAVEAALLVDSRYVVVKKSSFLPPFDERFVNYAYNKVQWLEHLRYRGYVFSILTDGFAVDVPHPLYLLRDGVMGSSALRKKFMSVRETTKQTLNKEMYEQFLAELRRNETDKSIVKYCKPTYSPLCSTNKKQHACSLNDRPKFYYSST